MARGLAFLPVIRDVFKDAQPTVEGRERVMQQLNRRVHEHPSHQRLPQRVQINAGGDDGAKCGIRSGEG